MDPNLYKAAVSGNLSYFENLEDSPDFEKELTPYKDTALHVATEFHQTKFAIKTLQVCRPLLLLANSTGNTALHIAAGEGNKELVEVFIDYMDRSDIETGKCGDLTRMVNWKEDTALHVAARRGRCECVRLLAEANPEVCSFVNKNGESPLYLLVASGYGIQSEIIINNDLVSSSSAFYCGPMGLTALHASVLLQVRHYAVKKGVEEIELLMRWRREMIRKGDDLGMTPLHFAAFYGRIEVVKLFVEYDSSAIYVMNNDGQSALHLAAYSGHIKILQQLVNCRPDCYKMVDKMGRTALHAAVLGKQKETIKFILETPSFEWLFNMADNDGNTPLHLAADFKFIQIIQTFSSNTKVRFDILNNKFWTPVRVYTQYNPDLESKFANCNAWKLVLLSSSRYFQYIILDKDTV
ncbi:ankyrin repeat-containing protein [Cucumis melo var. makuwa]|uniref:Ankyrin repeat-containing protein n=1 Tax=Cucumis melo var. makuwa TaxID=1194695 RepID=A0A5D3BDR1_CUCMM|nr:ankyrin repeat-containing protein [Cucumis melo var. makuwa]TYJ97912.1 ankyrin repeat-containing protein [Cucumis melo var. makuwa]